jgi:nucleotide-binding universal stress UspA family protein
MRRILCATDLSEASRPAVARAASLAAATGAELVLLHAFDVSRYHEGVPKPALAGVLAEERNGVMLALDALRERLGRDLPRVAGMLLDGYADEAILDTADAQEADLVVLGARARGEGTVADQVAPALEVPLLVARGVETGRFTRPLVATDFSESADRALATALELAAPDATIEVVHFLDVPALIAGHRMLPASIAADLDVEARRRGEALLARRSDPRLRFSCDEGGPRQGLLARVQGGRHDLVALGSQGRRGLRRLLLGSVSAALLRLAPCSVLVAR